MARRGAAALPSLEAWPAMQRWVPTRELRNFMALHSLRYRPYGPRIGETITRRYRIYNQAGAILLIFDSRDPPSAILMALSDRLSEIRDGA